VIFKIDPFRRVNAFEIFGFDFMLDETFTVYMIEANTNPCLELSCPLLSRIIPTMLESAFRIAVDPLLPPPDLNFKRGSESLQENKFMQVFDEEVEKDDIYNLYKGNCISENGFNTNREEELNE
jgi:hypothetical protein